MLLRLRLRVLQGEGVLVPPFFSFFGLSAEARCQARALRFHLHPLSRFALIDHEAQMGNLRREAVMLESPCTIYTPEHYLNTFTSNARCVCTEMEVYVC